MTFMSLVKPMSAARSGWSAGGVMAGGCRIGPGSEGRMLEAPGAAGYGEHGVARVFCRVGECR